MYKCLVRKPRRLFAYFLEHTERIPVAYSNTQSFYVLGTEDRVLNEIGENQ